ncbi:hypothetical protein H112_01947 [Trichophyton rubrum D6]|uniref:DUF7924 domain-containing protein n=4 Tax=Trichophyton TaxID=5550 RepID=A0A178EZD8_TRIRU|nr:uncharacterized protein TERG_06714 [Trichophyton rubrum CBS 118892]EZF25751.1 hypothetical protein H100_01943 [Trichophyton rubrum MR850]EZF44923.1 hypothetical protein H102_01942 [Trichophyton rubrum CBS 100081]EZF55576.1 hypothetical protein H103_01953 [Trichophyton rubrum CBS 288.86]EZF66156.1 hypothetical protein H104_01928 [Trichophyton rubrum CBS 289.86]EZF76776.1 hypothetical protein H105_01957 [Trichophyton soudanense CBS 452.61]EZF87372.1 hypothetical protein H110_01952 [Trichophy
MPKPVSGGLSHRKRQGPEDCVGRRPSKRSKIDRRPPTFWDNLSRIWLTRDALEELDQRNSASISSEPPRSKQRPVTRLQEKERRLHQKLPSCTIYSGPATLNDIRRYSRGGGPDLSDLRNFPNPERLFHPMSTNNLDRRKRRAESPSGSAAEQSSANKTAKSSSTSAYNRNFEQNLIDNGIYLPGYKYPNGHRPPKPNNWVELNERLAQRRPSLSSSQFSEDDFEEFVDKDLNIRKEKPIGRFALSIIEGKVDDMMSMGEDYPFSNLAPLTDGTLVNARPDHFFGSRPEQLESQIRKDLSSYIVPSSQDSLPIIPNFFLETKGPDGSLMVATRQACYHGALGARGIHKLQNFKQDEESYDRNAYTITSTYHGGNLKIYTSHLVPRASGRPEYIMTMVNNWGMTGNIETFRQGASAYRNALDWAKEQREKIIEAANERLARVESEALTSEHVSEPTATLDGSQTSATSDETEIQDTAWSFAQPNDAGGPAASSKSDSRQADRPGGGPLAN